APNLDDRDTLRAALGVFRALPGAAKDYDGFVAKLPRLRLWPGGIVPADFRLALLAARPVGQSIDFGALSFLLGKLDREEPAAERSSAAEVLIRAKLGTQQLISLTAALKSANPLDIAKLLGVFAKSTDEKVGLALVKALREKEVRAMIRAEMVKPILDKYPKAVKDEAEKLYAELDEARKGEKEKLDKMLADLKPGDIRRGQLVFNSQKANCIACHKVGYVGGTAGPDLTRIGGIRTERDLLESILFPSASFVRSYEPVRVLTTDERTFNGVLKKDAPDEIIVVVAADKEERVARVDVESISPSTVSLMPGGLEQQLTPQELADLIAFLRACK
ncbi:MAG: c-type cytochrome, partial [Planctomycetia bacterium]|nr:c-type cytochrome [Planctomycetia bacterium]